MGKPPRPETRRVQAKSAKATPKPKAQRTNTAKTAKAAKAAKAAKPQPKSGKTPVKATKQTAKSTAKFANTKPQDRVKNDIRMREAQRARTAGQGRPNRGRSAVGPKGRPVQGRASQTHRSWRSWWATAEMDRINREKQNGSARVPARVGVFTNIRDWSGAKLAGVFTLLLVSFFTCSIALGAGSITAGVIAFLFLGASIAVATSGRQPAHQDSSYVVEPMESARDFRVEDVPVDDDVPSSYEVNSLADLDRSFSDAERFESLDFLKDTASGDTENRGTVATPPLRERSVTELIPRQPTAGDIDDGVLASNTPHPMDNPVKAKTSDEDISFDLSEVDVVFDEDVDLVDDEPVVASPTVSSDPGTDVLSAYVSADEGLAAEAVRDVAATLLVSDLDRSTMFYTELLGLVEIDRAADAVLLEAGFGRVLLWQREDAPAAGNPVMHLTFEVGDITTAYETLRAKGIAFTHEPRSALRGTVHDVKAASFLDPDGHGLAITELTQH